MMCYTVARNGEEVRRRFTPAESYFPVIAMSMLDSLKGLFSGGGGPASLHKRGMANAKKENWEGAIADYTAVVDSDGASDELKAMARFNRALAYSKQGDHDSAEADLRAVVAMTGAPANITHAAKEKLARWEKRRGM